MSNFEYLDRLTESRNRDFERFKEILNRAAADNRDPSPEERAELDKLETAITETKAEAERYQRMAAAMAVGDAFREARIETSSQTAPLTESQMLAQVIRGQREGFESRALQSAGGTAIDSTFYDRVTVYERTLVPVLQVATVLNTARGETITLPRLTADVAYGGTAVAEAAGITELDPTISSVTLGAFKAAVITLWSRELDTDEVIGLEDLVARTTARELSIDLGTWFTTGTATTQPNGFITAATNGGTAGGTASGTSTDTFFAAKDLVDLYYGLAVPYRQSAVWMVSTTAAAKMRAFRDSTGNFIWQPGQLRGEGGIDRFLGLPVYENPAMAAVASATKSVAVGDFSRYFIRRLPMRVERSTEYKFNTDQLALKTVERVDGNLVDTIAIRYLVSANT